MSLRSGLPVLLAAALLPLAGVTAAQAATPVTPADPPVFTPADGAVVRTTDVDVTVAYDAFVGTVNDNHLRFLVVDTTTAVKAYCADPFHVSAGNTTLSCRLRNLIPGHSYKTAVSFEDQPVRVDAATWTVSAPALTSSSPADRSTVTSPAAVTATYDVPLAAGSTARLFSSTKGARAVVPVTTDVSGSTVTVTPSTALPAGGYALVVDAVAADDATSVARRTVDFTVGDTAADYPTAPTTYDKGASGVCCFNNPRLVDVRGPALGGAVLGVTVYDAADPAVQASTETPLLSGGCLEAPGICPSFALPLTGMAGRTVRWFAYSRIGDVTTSGPDNPLVVSDTGPTAPTNVVLTPPTPDSPDYFHLTADVGPEAVGVQVLHTEYPGGTTVANVVPVAGHVDAFLSTWYVEDGDVTFDVTAVDVARRAASTQVTAPKETIPLAPTGTIGTISNHVNNLPQVGFNERLLPASTLVLRDPSGKVFPGSSSVSLSGRSLLWTPSQPFTVSGDYTYDITAYAKTCTASDLSTCEKWVGTRVQPVDVTPPAAPTDVVVTPRATAGGSVTVTGKANGYKLVITVGSTQAFLYLSSGDGVPAAFDSGPMDISAEPRALLPVQVTAIDALDNPVTLSAGVVDNRWASGLSAVALSPSSVGNGQTTRLSGRLTRLGGIGTAGHVVELLQKRDDGTVGRLGYVTTAGGGAFAKDVVVTRSGTVYASFHGDASQRPVVGGSSPRLNVAAVSHPADGPGSVAAARMSTALAVGVPQAGRLATALDVDVFPFAVPASGRYRLLLGNLPVAARLDVLDRQGRVIASSNVPGRGFEDMIVALRSGTWFVRVTSLGAASAIPYRLTVSRLAAGGNVLSKTVIRQASYGHDLYDGFVELYNNRAATSFLSLQLDCRTAAGALTRRRSYSVGPVRAYQRIAGRFTVDACPSGSALRVLPITGDAVLPAAPTVVVLPGTPRRVGDAVVYPFGVRNTGRATTRAFHVQLVVYAADGAVRQYVEAPVPALAPGATYRSSDNTLLLGSFTPNRVRWLVVF